MRAHLSQPLLPLGVGLLALATLVSAAVPAAAAPAHAGAAELTPSELSVARQLFAEAKADADAGRWSEAAAKFRRAAAIKDTPGIRFHLARCEEEQGAFVEALVEYDRARELIESGVKAADVEKLLPEARARVEAKAAQLTLRLEPGLGASVELDGKALSISVVGAPFPVNPGQHRLRVAAPGRAHYAAELELGVGEKRELSIVLAALTPSSEPAAPRSAAVAASPPEDAKSGGVEARTVLLASEATLFVAALGTGIAFTFVHASASERYDAANAQVLAEVGSDPSSTACTMPVAGCSELDDARQDRDRAAAIQTVGFVAAGVSAAAFGLTYWLWPRSAELRVGARPGPGSAELALSGQF